MIPEVPTIVVRLRGLLNRPTRWWQARTRLTLSELRESKQSKVALGNVRCVWTSFVVRAVSVTSAFLSMPITLNRFVGPLWVTRLQRQSITSLTGSDGRLL